MNTATYDRTWAQRRIREGETFAARRRIALEDLEEYPEERVIVLLREWYRMNRVNVPETEQQLLVTAHRERAQAGGVPEEKREASREWLRERGYLPE